ncbi:MAG: hypothetical protein ACLPKB_05405 [Xanthobacteraceae bacterium]
MRMQRLGNRFYRLKALDRLKPPANTGRGYDPALADQWNDDAGARLFELDDSEEKEGLTDDQRAEYAHLTACAEA